MGIAEQMGRVLQRTSISVNIKERLDFSCALFDPAGALVANAPHLPVHLGAMSAAIQFQVRTLTSACLLFTPCPGGLQPRMHTWCAACRPATGVRRAKARRRGCTQATSWHPTTRSWRAGRTCRTSRSSRPSSTRAA